MKDDLEIEYGGKIEEEDLFQFELTVNTSLIYNVTQDIWYLQTDEDIEDNICIIEDKKEDIEYTEEIEIFDYILLISDFHYYKEIVEAEQD